MAEPSLHDVKKGITTADRRQLTDDERRSWDAVAATGIPESDPLLEGQEAMARELETPGIKG